VINFAIVLWTIYYRFQRTRVVIENCMASSRSVRLNKNKIKLDNETKSALLYGL